MVSVESVGLSATRVGYSWLMGWGLSPDGARGWVAGRKQGKRRRRPQKLT